MGLTPAERDFIRQQINERARARLPRTTQQKRHTRFGPRRMTRRRLEVLEAAANGATLAETADLLCVTVEAVKSHRQHLLVALNARNMLHAVAIAFRQGELT